MATNFPASVDTLTNPVSNDSLNSPSHSAQHTNANDAIEAIETYLLGGGASGLVLVKTQTIGTAVSSVAVTSAFSATYDSYRVVVTDGVGSTGAQLTLTLTGSTASYYSGAFSAGYAGTNAAVYVNNGSGWTDTGRMDANFIAVDFELVGVALAKWTRFKSTNVTNSTMFLTAGVHQVATAYTGFTITPTTGTMTGGTIRVYGYKNS